MATKAQLEQQIMELRDSLAHARREADTYKTKFHELSDTMFQTIENIMYKKFMTENGAFLDRYMHEWCAEHLSVTGNGEDFGSLDITLRVDDEAVHTDTCYLSQARGEYC